MSKGKRIWDNYQEIGTVPKGTRLRIKVAVGVRDGVKYLNLREFYVRKTDGQLRPTRDGIAIPIEMPVPTATSDGKLTITMFPTLPEILKVFSLATTYAETMALYDEDRAVYLPVKQKGQDDNETNA